MGGETFVVLTPSHHCICYLARHLWWGTEPVDIDSAANISYRLVCNCRLQLKCLDWITPVFIRCWSHDIIVQKNELNSDIWPRIVLTGGRQMNRLGIIAVAAPYSIIWTIQTIALVASFDIYIIDQQCDSVRNQQDIASIISMFILDESCSDAH